MVVLHCYLHDASSHSVEQPFFRLSSCFDPQCDSGAAIRAMLDLMSSSPTKIMFTAPGCSPAAEPIAEAATFWGAVQVMKSEVTLFFGLIVFPHRFFAVYQLGY